MSSEIFNCPSCEKQLYINKTKCSCGWQKKNFRDSSYNLVPEVCGVSGCCEKDLLKFSPSSYVCRDHWDEWILKNENNPIWEMEAKRIRSAKKFEEEAKACGLSAKEYFKQNSPNWFGAKEKILEKAKNPENAIKSSSVDFNDVPAVGTLPIPVSCLVGFPVSSQSDYDGDF